MKIVGLSFDHMHMADLLRHVYEHPTAEIVGVADSNPKNLANMAGCAASFELSSDKVFTDYRKCLEATHPDIAILCPVIARHAELTEMIASYGVHVIIEKPFAVSLEHADRMIAATEKAGVRMAINWPLAWYPPHNTAYRLICEGVIGEVTEVHYYDGNRGPDSHTNPVADRETTNRRKNESWFYQKAAGGGSLIDYLGYGVTLGTWFHGGKAPLEVTCMWNVPEGLEIDEHAITIARYDSGLSKFETRWGTFTDPWINQPQPKCGFVIVGTGGTIASYDYESTIRLQTSQNPVGVEVLVDTLQAPMRSCIEHFVDVLTNGTALHGPLDPSICRTGQRIIDAAIQSATEKRTVRLPQ